MSKKRRNALRATLDARIAAAIAAEERREARMALHLTTTEQTRMADAPCDQTPKQTNQ